jgi:polygalacturonase
MIKRYFLFFFLAASINLLHAQADLPWVKDVGARKVPSSKKVYWVNNFGKIADSNAVISPIIQKAVDECAKKGGGIVAFKPGIYTTGAVFLKKGVHLKIDKGVLLKGSTSFDDYPEMDTRIAGIEMRWPSALINIIDQQNVMVSGEGKINAQGIREKRVALDRGL